MRRSALLFCLCLSCRLGGFGTDVPVSCVDGERTCATLNDEHPTGDSCKVWDCIDNRCQVVPKDSNKDGFIDPECEGTLSSCAVAEEYSWPLNVSGQSEPLPTQVSFDSRVREQALMVVAMFHHPIPLPGYEPFAGMAVWSQIDHPPTPHRMIEIDRVGDAEGDGFGNYTYTTLFPVITDSALGLVATLTEVGNYWAGGVVSTEATTDARIHTDFDAGDKSDAGNAGNDVGMAKAAWTEQGILVAGVKKCPPPQCMGGLNNDDVFVHLLKEDEQQSWSPAATNKHDHVRLGKGPDTAPLPTIVGLPSDQWLIAHIEENQKAVRMHAITAHWNTTTASHTQAQLARVVESQVITEVSLALGVMSNGELSVALTYVMDNRVYMRLFALDSNASSLNEIAKISASASSEGTASKYVFSVYHPVRKEWLVAWDLADAFAVIRVTPDGKIIPASYFTMLSAADRRLPQGIHFLAFDAGYMFVSYAIDDSDPMLLTGKLDCKQ